MNPRTGRPPLPPEERRSIRYEFRVTPAEKATIDSAGGSTWVRDVVLKAARRQRR